MTQMMIRIKGCKDPMMWYKHKIGQYVPYIRTYEDDCYLSRDDGGFTNIVRLEDGEVVDLTSLKENSFDQTQQEILDLIQEECAELIQAISKIRRFGKIDEVHNNLQNMCTEFADLICLIEIAKEKIPEVGMFDFRIATETKRLKLMRYSRIFDESPAG